MDISKAVDSLATYTYMLGAYAFASAWDSGEIEREVGQRGSVRTCVMRYWIRDCGARFLTAYYSLDEEVRASAAMTAFFAQVHERFCEAANGHPDRNAIGGHALASFRLFDGRREVVLDAPTMSRAA